jgi:hypothetical protein
MGEAGAPYEMMNLAPRMTGLPMTIWASPRGQARHDLRIKVNPTHGRQMIIRDAISVAVRPVPCVVGTLQPADRQAVFQWIAMNEEALVDYWKFRIDTDEFSAAPQAALAADTAIGAAGRPIVTGRMRLILGEEAKRMISGNCNKIATRWCLSHLYSR